MSATPCSAVRPGEFTCTNGFVQTGPCHGVACHACGRPTDDLPWCLRDDIAPRHLTEDGRPRYYRTEARP